MSSAPAPSTSSRYSVVVVVGAVVVVVEVEVVEVEDVVVVVGSASSEQAAMVRAIASIRMRIRFMVHLTRRSPSGHRADRLGRDGPGIAHQRATGGGTLPP